MKDTPKQKSTNTSYFKRIFLMMALAVFSVLTLAMLFLYFEFRNVTMGQMEEVNRKFLKNAAENISYKNEDYQRTANRLSNSGSAAILYSQNEITPYDITNNVRMLDQNLMENGGIHSVYFYNVANDLIYMIGRDRTYARLGDFFDDEIVGSLDDDGQVRIGPLVRTIPLTQYSWDTVEVYTYIYKQYSDGRLKMAYVVNVYLDELFGILKSQGNVYGGINNQYLVYNEHGQLLYRSFPTLDQAERTPEEIFREVQKETGNGSFTFNAASGKMYCNIFHDQARGWYFLSFAPLAEVTNSMQYLLIIFAAIFAGAILLGLLIVFALSKFLYRPIGNINQALQKSSFTGFEVNSSNEIAFISESIEKATDSLAKLFEYKEKNQNLAQTTLLREQLLYNRYSSEEYWAKCREQEADCGAEDSFLLIYASQYIGPSSKLGTSPHDQVALNFAIANVFYELLQPVYHVQHLPLESNDIIFLCGYSGPLPEATTELLKSMQLTFGEYFRIHLSFVVSAPVANPEDFHRMFKTIRHINSYGFFMEESYILYATEFDEERMNSGSCPPPDYDTLEAALRKGDNTQARGMINDYFDVLAGYDIESAHASLSLLSVRLGHLAAKINSSIPVSLPKTIEEQIAAIPKAGRISEAKEMITTIIDNVAAHILEIGEESFSFIYEQIVAFIAGCYNDFNLSNKSISKRYNLSASYLNNNFKQRSGLSVSAYIKRVRLDKAADLLKNSGHPVEAIAAKVGFENTKYFYTIFKQEYGVSPSAYRMNENMPGQEQANEHV